MSNVNDFIQSQALGLSSGAVAVDKAMMALGSFVFWLQNAAYQELSRQHSFNWKPLSSLSHPPIYQYLGQGESTLSLSGEIYPYFFKPAQFGQIKEMVALAKTGQSLNLMGSDGQSQGCWLIQSIQETHTEFCSDGSPKKISFNMKLVRDFYTKVEGE
jgi:phage protein U